MSLKKIGDYLSEASWELDKENGKGAEDFEKVVFLLLREMENDLARAIELIEEYNEENERNI